MEYHVILLLVLFAGVYGGPAGARIGEASISTCSQLCTGSTKFNYAPGSTYQYKYEGETRTSMLGSSEDHSTIGINALIEIEVLSKCELLLKVNDVSIFAYDSKQYTDQDKDKKFAQALEKLPLRFSFQDGKVESVCPHSSEETWAVNIKKGILSSLQNSMDSFDLEYKGYETDVTGQCETEYKVAQRGWRSLTIKKSKDLSTCSHRQGFDSAIQTTPFRMSSGMKSLPIMKSTHTCDQDVSTSGMLTRSICHEMHVLRPFSKDNSGAATEVTQTITFVQERQGTSHDQAECGLPEELYFEHAPSDTSTNLVAKDALNILRDLCDTTATEVTPVTSRQFSTLVSTMKHIEFSGLRRVYNQIMRDSFCNRNQERVRRFYIDAIPMVGTEASIELMKTLISNDDIRSPHADMWLASIAFVNHPTKQMIKYVQELAGLQHVSSKVLLPLSAMVQSYCRVNPSCAEVQEVADFIDILKTNIGGGCKADQKHFKLIMMSLRALGNMRDAEMVVPSLYNCISETDNSMDIRVAAIQAFRKLPCATDRNNLMAIYRDTTGDAELRISAYLAVMRCPSPYSISQIQETLASEEIDQVGSFVWSHITNLLESSDPDNVYVQQLLDDMVIDKEFDLDKMKFSRNYEVSFYMDKYNTGAKVDSNMVWSSKSFVPRSATLNLTMNLFGESMNLLEVGGRVEGLEHMLETYFGTAGYYNDETKGSNDIPDADPTLAKLSKKKLNNIKNKAKSTVDELRGALYTRMFGSEVSYNMVGANNGVNDQFSGSEMLQFLQKLRNNEKQELSVTRNVMFLDSSYTLPTAIGLPLMLAVNGTTTVALNVGGLIDMKKPRSNVVIEGNFEPSASVEIDSMMTVDAVVFRGGLKMASTLYTSTGAHAKVELTGGNVLDLSFDITKETSEIVDAKSAFFMVYNDIEQEQKMINVDREEKTVCTGSRLTRVTGIQFCAGYSVPNASSKPDAPNFPFTGPVSFSVIMNKLDLPNGYKLEVKTIKTPVQTLFRFKSDTPGSKVERGIGLDVDVKHADKTLNVVLTSPWKKVTLTGDLIDTASVKGLVADINIDEGTRVYKLDTKILIDKTKDRVTYTPQISLEIPDWKHIQLTGGINYNTMKSLDADLLITGAQDNPIVIQASILNTNAMIGAKGKVSYDEGEGYRFEMFSKRKIEKRKLRSRYMFEPRIYIRTPDKELLEFNGNAFLITGKSFKATGSLEKLTKIPFNINVDFSTIALTKKKKRVKSMGRINLTGPKLSNKLMVMYDNRANKNIFTKVRWDYNFGNGWKDTIMGNSRVKINFLKFKKNIKITSTLNSMRNNKLDGSMSMNYVSNRYKTNLDAYLKYGENLKDKASKETMDLSVVAKHTKKNTVDYTVKFKFPAKAVDVTITGDNMHDGRSVESHVQIQYHPQRVVSFGIHLHNRTELYPNYAGELTIKLPQNREMSFAGAFGKENDNKYMSNLEFEIIKGRRTRFDTVLKIATDKLYEFEVGARLPDLEPVRILGSYMKAEYGHTVEASFKKAEKLYRIYTQGIYEHGKVIKLRLDVTVPSRKIKLIIGSSRVNTETHMLMDVQWNVDSGLDQRFLTNVTYDFKSWDDFEIASQLHYPTRTIDFNMKHSAAARYITNIELSWSPKEQIEINIIFRDDEFNAAFRTELSVLFTSPFKSFEDLGLAVSLIRDAAQYQTKSSVTWAKKKKVLVSATAKVPFDVNSINIVGSITTPFAQYKTMTAMIQHSLSDSLKSNVLVQWGKNKLSISSAGQLQYTRRSRSFNGKVDLRTPFEGLRILVLNAEHTDDSRQFSSKLTTETMQYSSQVGRYKYNIEMDMTHNSVMIGLNNVGTVKILIPNDEISIIWELSSQIGRTRAMIDITPMRGNRFKLDFGETHQMVPNRVISSTFEILIPTETLQELLINYSHEDKPGFVRTSASVTMDNLEMMSARVNYQNNYGSLKFDSLIKSIYTEDIVLKLTSAHSIMPYNGKFEVKWGETPYRVTAISSVFYNEFGLYDNSLTISTPMLRSDAFAITTTRQRGGLNWLVRTEVSVVGEKVSLSTTYRFDHVKLATVSLKSSFPRFPGIDTSFKVDGNPIDFHGDTSFTMRPYVNKISTDFSFAYYAGTRLMGTFNLNTPFRQYPYMKAKVNSNLLGMSRVSSFEVEYLPTQIVKVHSDYRFTSLQTLEGTVRITSPYTNNHEVMAGFTHVGNSQEFKTKAKVTCDCFRRPVFLEGRFSSKDGVESTFAMGSPFRGYETVKWNLIHKGTLDDFNTQAEYETNGKKIRFVNIFSMRDSIQYQIKFFTPFANITNTHVTFSHAGKFPNTKTHCEVGYNDRVIKSDFDLTHNMESTVANAVVTTPFKRYEDIKITVTNSGTLSDFVAKAVLVYDQTWHASLNHKFDGQDLQTSAILKSPFLPDDVTLSVNHSGIPLDFQCTLVYTLGPAYETSSHTKFAYKLPNLTASTKTVTTIGEETRVNEIALEHNFMNKDNVFIDISTNLRGQIREKKANAEFKFNVDKDSSMSFYQKQNMLAYLIIEVPHPDFSYNKFLYEYTSNANNIRDLSLTGKITFETPQLEKFSYTSNVNVTRTISKEVNTYAYGDQVITGEVLWQPGSYLYKHESPIEGFERSVLDVTYRGKLFDIDTMSNSPNLIDWDMDVTLTSSALSEPVKIALNGNADNTNDQLKSINSIIKVTYDSDKEIAVDFSAKPETRTLRISTPFEGYESYESVDKLSLMENEVDYSLSVTCSALEEPVVFTAHTKYGPALSTDTELAYKFTSGITDFSHFELDARNAKPTPYVQLVWEDSMRKVKEVYVEGPIWKYEVSSNNVQAGLGVTINTPFKDLEDMKVNFEHQHFTSPMRAKEVMLVQYNGKKYLDVDAEVGALNKFSGSISFREPRQMDFSFNGVNEGESVNADLVLNWNKLDKDSKFRLQFGLADSGDRYIEKKAFNIRIVNPGRIINIQNKFENMDGKVSSSGTVTWDEKEDEKVSYAVDYSALSVGGSMLYSTEVKFMLPTRTVEMSGSHTNSARQIISTGTLLWDAENDRDKQVQVKIILSPTDIKKMAAIDLKLPSMDKALSLSTELALNDGSRLLDGQTKLTYSPEVNKAVLLKYVIQRDGTDPLSYRAGWSIDHVDTQTHVEMMSSLSSSNRVTSGDVQIQYRATNRDMTALQAHTELDMNERELKIKISSTDQSAELTGDMTSDSPYIVTVATSRNMKPTWKTVWTIDTEERTLDASMTYDDFKGQVITRAYFPNSTFITSETLTQTSSDTVQEGRVSAELVDRKLHGHLKWRPQLIAEAANFGSETLQRMTGEISPVVEGGMKELGEIMMRKHRLISTSLTEELAPIAINLEEDVKTAQQDLRKMRRELKKMYRQNELYLRTIEESYSGTVKYMLTCYSVSISKLGIAYTKAQEAIEEITKKIDEYPVTERYNKLMASISEHVKKGDIIVKEEVKAMFATLKMKMEKFSTFYDDTVNDVSNLMKTLLEVLLDELALEPYMDDVKSAYHKLLASSADLPSIDNTQVLQLMQQVQQLLIDSMSSTSLSEKYKQIYKRTEELLSEHFGDMMDNDNIREMNEAILDLYKQVSWVYKYTELNVSLKDLIQKLLDVVQSKVFEEFNQLPLGILDLHKSKITTFDLENGEIEFDLYLPIPLDNFDEMMRFTVDKYMKNMKKLASKYFPRSDICLWDFYYAMPPVRWSMQKDWLPPFDVFGVVSGRQHITTFDGLHYDIAGLCSYVLAQDVVDGNFTVVLKYTGGQRNLRKDSIVAMVDGKTVEMYNSYMVTVDGQPTELPYRSDRLTIVRSANTITLDSKIGLTMVSDFSKDYHIIGVSGWYYGKVAGLLGNIDYEQDNDRSMPDGTVSTRSRKFLNSWEVNGSCRSTMEYTNGEPEQKSEECAAVFNASSSTLRPCFLEVYPDMYQHSCDMDPSAVCDIATLYTKICDRYGININIPSSCVKCTSQGDQEFSSDETVRYDHVGDQPLHDSMDVVFVVEERRCNQDVVGKLKSVVYQLEQTLTKSGTSGNRYSLVGYAGSMIDTHTMEGQLFNEANKFAMGLENLHFNNLGPFTDPLSALKYASDLPFRTAVKKTVILVSCSPCEEAKGYSYSSVSTQLHTRDITLHVLRQNGFQLKTNRSPKSQIFGVDTDEAFIGQKRDDGDIFSELDIPQDYCTSLALNTNGSVFDMGHLFVASVRHQRRFMDKFSTRVQQTDSQCQVCSCALDHSGAPQSICRHCDRQPFYFKPIPDMMQKVAEYKNAVTHKIQTLLF